MKKYFAIFLVAFSASSVFSFTAVLPVYADDKLPQDPLELELELSAQKYKAAILSSGALFDQQYKLMVEANAKKPIGSPARLTDDELKKIKESMDAAKKAVQIVIARETGALCENLGKDIAACKLNENVKETIKQIAIVHAQAAAARGELSVEELTRLTTAYLTRWIALSKTTGFQETLADAGGKVTGGQRQLAAALRNGELQAMYAAPFINSPFNFFGLGRLRLSAGQQALLMGAGMQAHLSAIAQNLSGLQSVLMQIQAGIASGKLDAEKIAELQASGEEFARRLHKHGQAIIDAVKAGINDGGAINVALGGDVRSLQGALIAAEQHLSTIEGAIAQLHSKEVQDQLKALADASKVRVDITKPLRDNLPQLQRGRPGSVSTPDNPVVMDQPIMLPPMPTPKPMSTGIPQGSSIQAKVIRGGIMTTETINSADPRYRILNTPRIDGLPVYEQFRP